jgi:hypothetical protein
MEIVDGLKNGFQKEKEAEKKTTNNKVKKTSRNKV